MAGIERCALKNQRKSDEKEDLFFFVPDSLGVPLLSFRQAHHLRDIFSESLRYFDAPLVPALDNGMFEKFFDVLVRL